MSVKQLSVFLENTPGKLADFTTLLGDHGIDLVSLMVADTTDFGILRGITPDYERAYQLITEAGYTVKLSDVLAVSVADEPGGLAKALRALSSRGVTLEYLYSFVRSSSGSALIILRVDKPDEAVQALNEAGVKLLTQEDIQAL